MEIFLSYWGWLKLTYKRTTPTFQGIIGPSMPKIKMLEMEG